MRWAYPSAPWIFSAPRSAAEIAPMPVRFPPDVLADVKRRDEADD
ncbi:hypothetical protein [Micromonospora sp. RTP1Z1]|nr:hypothetical protein [Micromonospora sp. RTP1Z1]